MWRCEFCVMDNQTSMLHLVKCRCELLTFTRQLAARVQFMSIPGGARKVANVDADAD